jgi:hypothetical protein
MEYLPSRSLAASLADRGSMAAADVAAVGSQIASALAAAHASGIVHRDIKPANILITDAGVAKITDFGIARAAGDVTVTQTGMFAGTPAYLAPEVARGGEPSSASDVFSFGATLYDAVEGGPPFPERHNQLALLRLVAEGKVQPPRQAGVLTALLMQLLRSEPDERPTMSQASRMLADLASPTPSRSAEPAGQTVPTTPTLPDLRPPPAQPADAAVVAPAPPTVAEPLPPLLPLSDRPAAYRPTGTPKRPGQQRDLRLVFIGAGVVVVALVVGIVLLLNPAGGTANQAGNTTGGITTRATPPATGTRPSVSTVNTPPLGAAPTSGTIGWSAAGQTVVNYFGDINDAAVRFGLLTPGAQAAFGGMNGFEQYWGQFSQLSSAHAIGVSTNADGSVAVPIDVTYTTGTGSAATTRFQHQTLRVVQENGRLLIDALAK